MTEEKTNLGEVLYGSVLGLSRIGKDFLAGALVVPLASFAIPSVIRTVKDTIKTRSEGRPTGKVIDLTRSLGAVTSVGTMGLAAKAVYNFISEHPYITLAPFIASNLLSIGYERYRRDKLKEGLEERID